METRLNRWWNFTSISILFFALIITSLKIQATGWTENLFLLNWLTFVGYFLGLAIGYSVFKPFLVSIFIFFFSIIILPWSIGLTYASSIPWITRLENIFGRIIFSINQLLSDTRIDDPILFLALLSLIIWFTSLFAGYNLVRKSHFWIPVLISGITIFASDFYDQSGNHLYTGFFIFFVLILISQVSFQETGRNWRSKGIPVDSEVNSLIRRTSFIVAIIIVFLAWNVTNIVSAFQKDSPQQKQVIAFIADIQNQFAKITSPLQGTAYIQSEFFGNTVNLGSGSDLSDEIVFEITVDQRQPTGVRYYWKARSYDTYQDGQWISTIESSANFEANESINQLLESQNFPNRTFSITTKMNIGILYSPPYPQKINLPINAYFQILPDEKIDVSTFALERIVYPGESYQVTNMIPNPTISLLRKSTQDYPEWVIQKYLQLPSGFSDKVSSLAFDLTSPHENSYDKTIAITNYLRNNISYNKQIPSPPIDQNLIEWFLFDLKQGFCNYYATAEVLMLRSVGIPARIAFGYAEGEAMNNDNTEFKVSREQL
ncbi:MAG TPA: transglutaminase domain-containing protein, partial [Anaerolineaceae bacterium]|nr:transglutaminase domain-containing protein [Anaerolineaceae bacterium]